jgi:hypothetical protein
MGMLSEFTRTLEERERDQRERDSRDDDRDNGPALSRWSPKGKDKKNYRDDRRNDRDDDRNDKKSYDKPEFSNGGNLELVKAAADRFIESKVKTVNELSLFAQKMLDRKFPEKLANVFKTMDKEGTLDSEGPVIASMIFEVLEKNRNKFRDTEDEYLIMVDKLLKPRVTELSDSMKKKHRPSKTILREIALVIPTEEMVRSMTNLNALVATVNSKLYVQAEEWFKKGKDEESSEESQFSIKGITKLFEAIYGEENINKVAIACLLEKRSIYNNIKSAEGKELWNEITNFALETLNDIDNVKDIDKLLGSYTYTRFLEYETDSGRRVILKDVDEDEYKTLAKSIKALCRDEKIAGRLS